MRPDAFRIRRDDRVSSRAVLSAVNGRLRLAFRYADDLPMNIHPEAEASFRYIRAWIADPANARTFRLESGDILIFDNTRMLHGRTAFSKDGGRSPSGLWCDGVGAHDQLRLGLPIGTETAVGGAVSFVKFVKGGPACRRSLVPRGL